MADVKSTLGAAPKIGVRERFPTLRTIRREAERNMKEPVSNYVWEAAGDRSGAERNLQAFQEYLYHTPIFAGTKPVTTSVDLLGAQLSVPIVTAPFGNATEFNSVGHFGVGRAAERCGVKQLVPEEPPAVMEAIAQASTAAWAYQIGLVGPVDDILARITHAKSVGYEYICAYYSPGRSWREQLMEDAYTGSATPEQLEAMAAREELPRWDWSDLRKLISQADLPLIVKGVMTARDARLLVDAGASALYVSNFGGRNVNRTPATVDTIAGIRAAVGPDVPMIVDSGIRTGSDIVTSLALGANAVAIGRLPALGLAADGENGVVRTLELLAAEVRSTLAYLGVSDIAELDETIFASRPSYNAAELARLHGEPLGGE
jgi:isopentenyl diphosphate isomerase/L-lactate dehydrogenase-like FMN-dependent dehydrogenase